MSLGYIIVHYAIYAYRFLSYGFDAQHFRNTLHHFYFGKQQLNDLASEFIIHPMVREQFQVAKDSLVIHTIDYPAMTIFNDDLKNGRITINNDYALTRVNGLKEADWSENLSSCTVENNLKYNPEFFDNFCVNFYWCYRDFTSECAPNYAIGITEP
jgi:hypothetical protein